MDAIIHLACKHGQDLLAFVRLSQIVIGQLRGSVSNTVVVVGEKPCNKIEEMAADRLKELPQDFVRKHRGWHLTQIELHVRDELTDLFLDLVSGDDVIRAAVLATPGHDHLVSPNLMERFLAAETRPSP